MADLRERGQKKKHPGPPRLGVRPATPPRKNNILTEIPCTTMAGPECISVQVCRMWEWLVDNQKRNTHSKQIVIEQLRHADDHIKGNRFEYIHHLHVFTWNAQHAHQGKQTMQRNMDNIPLRLNRIFLIKRWGRLFKTQTCIPGVYIEKGILHTFWKPGYRDNSEFYLAQLNLQ